MLFFRKVSSNRELRASSRTLNIELIMSTYKLTYFNAKGIAEFLRLLLAYGGVDFEDIRIESREWAGIKPSKISILISSIISDIYISFN